MKTTDHDRFWQLYNQQARMPIERACRHASRVKTDSTMDIDDMIAWVDTRVWTMLEKDAYPTFHDDPTPEQAIERIVKHAPTLARWSYLALCRSHFRRLEQRNGFMTGMSRAERLSMASAVDSKIEKREELDNAISSLRKSLNANEKQRLAASVQEKEDRTRVALVLGATRREDDLMIRKVNAETLNTNTVQQMRSRARKRAQEILDAASKAPLWLLATAMILTISLGSSVVEAGEQSGGRKGSMTAPTAAINLDASGIMLRGEQSGGRRPGG
ncbi:MAG: hypothetical protein CMJ35_08190 [Phycisphaerae bacterium]|nr:hypothetical protein [Phycisphaerae bacterium]MBM91578.1 hypothetical protein [Phycisphaerae bacterium]HCT46433.1 hypothetical protein [Phycisphaerales bacterium]